MFFWTNKNKRGAHIHGGRNKCTIIFRKYLSCFHIYSYVFHILRTFHYKENISWKLNPCNGWVSIQIYHIQGIISIASEFHLSTANKLSTKKNILFYHQWHSLLLFEVNCHNHHLSNPLHKLTLSRIHLYDNEDPCSSTANIIPSYLLLGNCWLFMHCIQLL